MSVKDLIQSAHNKDASAFETMFSDIMSSRMKSVISKKFEDMFESKCEDDEDMDDEDEDEDEDEDDEDEDDEESEVQKMKTFKEIVAETVNPPKSPDERRFIAKHRGKENKHPVATNDQEDGGMSKDRSRKADRSKPEDELVYEGYRVVMVNKEGERFKSGVYEDMKKAKDASWKASKSNKWKSVDIVKESLDEEMSSSQEKKREEIVKSMKKKQGDFKEKYGDDWKSVMYATATKMAMKESVDLAEEIKVGVATLSDGKMVRIDEAAVEVLGKLYTELNTTNRKKMHTKLAESEKSFREILKFAKENV